MTSSAMFKEKIRDMGDVSDKLLRLRPVSFFYKPEYDKGPRTEQYGLIAEEVAKEFPELVAYAKTGEPFTVKYHMLAPLLLNEYQKQYRRIADQQQQISGLTSQLNTSLARVSNQEKQLSGLTTLLNASLERISAQEKEISNLAARLARLERGSAERNQQGGSAHH
jgi:hypothetical protein